MKYLLDTNIISETIKQKPDTHVQQWLELVPSNQLYVSVLTLGEIRFGIEKLVDSARKNYITTWLENDLALWFADHIMPVSLEVADKWGHISSQTKLPVIDSLIAATALVHNMKLVTRNVKDFKMVAGIEIINPWNFESNYFN